MNQQDLNKSSSASALLLLLFKRRIRMVVTGNSMLPTLCEGDGLLVKPNAVPEVGQIVVARDPRNGRKVIKRLTDRNAQGDCYLLGDNPSESTDSRVYGWVPAENIIGIVTALF